MKKSITILIFQILLIPFGLNANENFSVEIEALTLVMDQYKKEIDLEIESDTELNNKKPSYMALKQDECNATVKVTEKKGLEIFDVNVCKKEVYRVIN